MTSVNGAASGSPNGNGAAARPLDGVKLLDLTWFGAGPIGTRAMANLGADVIRVETEKRPDGLRIVGPRPVGSTSLNVSGYYNNFNAEKRSITLDLTTERGHELGLERSEEHTSELQSRENLVCRLLLEKKKINR